MESIVASGDRLHFFEYLEIDILQEYLRTGIHYFLQVLLGSHPSLVSWRYYAQEITALVDFVKDFYFLKRHKGTYAEHFYDVQRRTSRTMGKLWALANAFLWTIVPYLLAKLDALYN